MASGRKKSAGGVDKIDRPGASSVEPGATPDRRRPATADAGEAFLHDEEAIGAIERRHPEGLTSAQIVEAFTTAGVRLSEATFRKWVQLGLLPRSRRVGRKGKHQGSLGLYPASTVRQIAAVRRQMAAGLTVEDITRSHRLRDEVEALERGIAGLLRGFAGQLASSSTLAESERRAAEKQLEQLERQAAELVRRMGNLERRLVEPLEREARARAFGSGTSGGAGDLL